MDLVRIIFCLTVFFKFLGRINRTKSESNVPTFEGRQAKLVWFDLSNILQSNIPPVSLWKYPFIYGLLVWQSINSLVTLPLESKTLFVIQILFVFVFYSTSSSVELNLFVANIKWTLIRFTKQKYFTNSSFWHLSCCFKTVPTRQFFSFLLKSLARKPTNLLR